MPEWVNTLVICSGLLGGLATLSQLYDRTMTGQRRQDRLLSVIEKKVTLLQVRVTQLEQYHVAKGTGFIPSRLDEDSSNLGS